jgi:hypothetical protein
LSLRTFTATASLLVLSVPASAQQQAPQQPSAEQMRAVMQATMGAMVSVMGPMTEAVLEAQLNVAARLETADRLAQFKKNLYDSLVKKGFTPADALQITMASNPPSATPAAK